MMGGNRKIWSYKGLARFRVRLVACVRAKLGDVDGKVGLL